MLPTTSADLVPVTCSHPAFLANHRRRAPLEPGNTWHLEDQTLTHAWPWAVSPGFLATRACCWDQDTGFLMYGLSGADGKNPASTRLRKNTKESQRYRKEKREFAARVQKHSKVALLLQV